MAKPADEAEFKVATVEWLLFATHHLVSVKKRRDRIRALCIRSLRERFVELAIRQHAFNKYL